VAEATGEGFTVGHNDRILAVFAERSQGEAQ
jgi:hypothetical protein